VKVGEVEREEEKGGEDGVPRVVEEEEREGEPEGDGNYPHKGQSSLNREIPT
jgi:hypothetical protein